MHEKNFLFENKDTVTYNSVIECYKCEHNNVIDYLKNMYVTRQRINIHLQVTSTSRTFFKENMRNFLTDTYRMIIESNI